MFDARCERVACRPNDRFQPRRFMIAAAAVGCKPVLADRSHRSAPGCASPAPSKQPKIREPSVTRAVPLGGRPSPGCGCAAPWHGSSRARAVGNCCPDVAHVDRSCGSSPSARHPPPPACCRASTGRYPVVLGTFLNALAVVGDLTRHVAGVVKRVPVHIRGVTTSYSVRFLMRRGCGRSPLGTLPMSPGVLPGSPVLLPASSAHVPCRPGCLPAPVLHTVIQIHRLRPCSGS
jgi:hypothetical protein